jgi:transposase-like protein
VVFKRQVVKELLCRAAILEQLSRRYDISTGLIEHWKSRYMEKNLVAVEDKSVNVRALDTKM